MHCRSLYWPDDIPRGQNQAVRDVANQMVGILRADPDEYGGFSDLECARHKDNQFLWRLAQISLDLSPAIHTLETKHCKVPAIFVDAVGRPAVDRPAATRKRCRNATGNAASTIYASPASTNNGNAYNSTDGSNIYNQAQGLDDGDFLLEHPIKGLHADPAMADQALNDAAILNAAARESNAAVHVASNDVEMEEPTVVSISADAAAGEQPAALIDVDATANAASTINASNTGNSTNSPDGSNVHNQAQGLDDGEFLLEHPDQGLHADPTMADQVLNDAAILNAAARGSNAGVASNDASNDVEMEEPAVVSADAAAGE